jgi:prolyl oligopeptidase
LTFARSAGSAFLALATLATVVVPASAALPPAPVAKKIPVTDVYYGTKVVDPYRWMEEPNSPALAAYLKAQDDRTRAILASIPGRKALVERLTALADTVTASSGVVRQNGVYFFERITPDSNLSKLYAQEPGAAPRVIFDPATMSSGQHHFALAYFVPSDDAKYVAIGLTPDGAEPLTAVHVLDVATGKLLDDTMERAPFGVTGWSDDGKRVYYLGLQTLPPEASPQALYQNVRTYEHVIGTSQSDDRAVFGTTVTPGVAIDPNEFAFAAPDPDSPYAFGILKNGVQNAVRVYAAPKAQFGTPNVKWTSIAELPDQVTDLAIHGDSVYLLTSKDAPRFKILKTSLSHPDTATAQVVIGPSSRVIDAVAAAKDALYVQAREDGIGRILKVDYNTGEIRDVPLPLEGTIASLTTDVKRPGFTVNLQSWTVSPQWFAYDPVTNVMKNTNLDPPSPVDYSNIVAEEVQVKARDGVMVPLSIVHRKDMKLDGTNPTLLYAYGSYGISSSPSFSPGRLAWFEHGGVYAVAHVRGGGENGDEWHLAGKDANKINTINDFIDCAKWLIANKYTSPGKLGARGGSAGGITMGGAITQAPGLFAAVLDEIPVSDQLRIEFSSNGVPNIPEFGSVKTEAGFKNLYATSPVQHVVPGGKYPAVMLTTGANDPRVDPWEAAKMTATLQADSASGRPILLRVDYVGGHGLIGATKAQAAELGADEYGFLLWNMGVAGFQPAI